MHLTQPAPIYSVAGRDKLSTNDCRVLAYFQAVTVNIKASADIKRSQQLENTNKT